AVFGRKDAQQLALVRRMVADLDLPVLIEAAPIIRDADGLALSSRNRYLAPGERVSALALSRALAAGAKAAEGGGAPAQIVIAAHEVLDDEPGVRPDYLVLVDPDDFEAIAAASAEPVEAVLAVAARVGTTRLIDNVLVTVREG
ncbi:MAG: pantoate--beta-alanine ligase, partial [Actinomycetota bacterium]|nr:pantoate--beta-alanine ligase [Actinomycetota bacterium]